LGDKISPRTDATFRAQRERSLAKRNMSLLDLPVGEVNAGEETPREYLERTLLLPSLECAVEQMLKVGLGLRMRGVHLPWPDHHSAMARAGNRGMTLH
jgi:hypothetical protein